jgi:hypothetical protein
MQSLPLLTLLLAAYGWDVKVEVGRMVRSGGQLVSWSTDRPAGVVTDLQSKRVSLSDLSLFLCNVYVAYCWSATQKGS